MSADDIRDIFQHYQSDPELEANRLNRHPMEFEITMRHLKHHLPKAGAVLDVGCAAGVYSVPLAQMGYDLTAVDMIPALVDLCSDYAVQAGVSDRVHTVVADARDLSTLGDAVFDAGMLMGPLYHLKIRDERLRAIREVVSRLKPRAPFFSAHISRFGMLPHVVRINPQWVENREEVDSVLQSGHDGGRHPRDGSFRGYYATVAEIPTLHEEAGLETIAVAAADPGSSALDGRINDLPESQRKRWLDLMYQVSTEPSSRGGACHLLYIGRRV